MRETEIIKASVWQRNLNKLCIVRGDAAPSGSEGRRMRQLAERWLPVSSWRWIFRFTGAESCSFTWSSHMSSTPVIVIYSSDTFWDWTYIFMSTTLLLISTFHLSLSLTDTCVWRLKLYFHISAPKASRTWSLYFLHKSRKISSQGFCTNLILFIGREYTCIRGTDRLIACEYRFSCVKKNMIV